jgi:hypothetical protein
MVACWCSRRRFEAVGDLLEQVGDRDGFKRWCWLGVVVAGVGEQVADQSFERVGFPAVHDHRCR